VIAYLRGAVLARTASNLILDVNGVGYLIGASLSTLEGAGMPGDIAELHVYTAVREDAIALYGFLTLDEKDTFLVLTSVQGVGPKVALSLQGALPNGALERAISSGNAKALTAADGVGAKLAARICSEVGSKFVGLGPVGGAAQVPITPEDANEADARSALINLGFATAEAARVITAVIAAGTERTTEALIRAALKSMHR